MVITNETLEEAKRQVIADIESHAEWREEVSQGKMFGFLITDTGETLKAYSGQICGRSDWDGYVPAIFDYLQPDGYFKTHEAIITRLNHESQE
jgi:tRNA pseudouridine32 synthase/23S rRNA pseudouridine746 synthase